MYRFRSLENLLDRNELKKQEIYFCPHDELNDPFEGHANFFWQGDEIVWTNLLKHYILCLNHMFTASNFRTYKELFDYKFPVEEIFEFLEEKTLNNHINNIFESLLAENSIKDILYYLTNKKISINDNELLAGLRTITHLICYKILESNQYFINIPTNLTNCIISWLEKNINIKNTSNYLRTIEELYNKKLAKISTFNSIYENILLEYQKVSLVAQKTDPYFDKNILWFNYLVFDFPNTYIENIKNLIYNKWSTACFTTSYTNTASWSIYADKHTGVCLKFKTNLINNDFKISLFMPDTNDYLDYPFFKVNYNDTREEIDFFESINVLSEHIQNFWYKNKNGIKSSFYDLNKQKNLEDFYWNKFIQIYTTKNHYWSTENEYRLISWTPIANSARLWTYNFADLEEIIFGIKTPVEAKIKIIEIIESKLSQNPNIKISQAMYDNDKNTITTYPVDWNQSKTIN